MQELYVGHGSAPVLVAYLRVPTSHCPHGPGMDNFEIVLNDYADDNLGEDTPSSNALWSQAFGPDPTSARPDAGIPQQPQQLSAATHTQPQEEQSQPRPQEPPQRSQQGNQRPQRNVQPPSWLKISRETSRIQGVLPINCWSHLCSSSSSSSSSNSSNSSNSNISSSSSSSNSSKMDQL